MFNSVNNFYYPVCFYNPQAYCRPYAYRIPPPIEQIPYEEWAKKYHTANIKVINNVSESFAWKKEFIASAETSIELSANFAGGKDFIEILDLLKQKMKAKPRLRVHILLSEDLLEAKDRKRLIQLKKQFGNRFHYLITKVHAQILPFPQSKENHVKMLVVDGKYFVMGGSGIHQRMTREKAPSKDMSKEISSRIVRAVVAPCFRDTDLIGEGVTASIMRRHFFTLFHQWELKTEDKKIKNRFFSIAGALRGTSYRFLEEPHMIYGAKIKFASCGPNTPENNPITRLIVKRILKARRVIHIANFLFNPHNSIKQALYLKKTCGIKTIGHFSGSQSRKLNHIFTLNNRYNYDLLSKAYEFTRPQCLYHKTVLTVDGIYGLIGSYNFGQKSALGDNEIAIQIKDPRAVAQINQGLQEDIAESIELTGPKLTNLYYKVTGAPFVYVLSPLIA